MSRIFLIILENAPAFVLYLYNMEIRQNLELRKLLIPELNQSLKILALPLAELKTALQEELLNNPLLEEATPTRNKLKKEAFSLPSYNISSEDDLASRFNLISKKLSLQDILLRQLGMFTDSDEDFHIGQEIIGNIDDNGYLKATVEEIALALNTQATKVEAILRLIQQFEPAGVASRTIPECLLLQLEAANEKDALLKKIVEFHLEDVAKKNYTHIAKSLNEPLEKIEPLIKMILRLDPKPGRNYSSEEIQQVIPDIIIYDKDEEFEISINDEDIPTVNINKDYKKMLKDNSLDPQTKEFLTEKLKNALALLRSIFRRKATLRKITEAIAEIQYDAIRNDLSHLKPLTFQEVAKKIDMHESTVCRAVMNKYVKLPYGVVALKDFFSSGVQDKNGQSLSSSHIKRLIKDLIEQEDKKHPLSDQAISKILSEQKNLNISRRTITKYREEMKLLSSSFRRQK